MKQIVYISDFKNAFAQMGRKDQFSDSALDELFYHLTQYEEETGEELELDVIALCCDYVEMTAQEVLDNYGTGYDPVLDGDDLVEYIHDWLNDTGELVAQTSSDSFLFRSF